MPTTKHNLQLQLEKLDKVSDAVRCGDFAAAMATNDIFCWKSPSEQQDVQQGYYVESH